MPRFSYESWLIIFLFCNTTFCVVTMLEYAFIAYIEHIYGDSQETSVINAVSGPPMLGGKKPLNNSDPHT
jgi:hypothetical protein